MYKISVNTKKKTEFVDITDKIQKLVDEQELFNGIAIVYVPHTTAAVIINEGADPAVQCDILTKLNDLVPSDQHYTHAEGNSDAHIKASILGSSETVIVEDNSLQIGTWQHVFLFEGDGPRNRTIFISLISY
ncbi:MAG: secondary thiamine-phosphate synthase enzyme YjbQ [Candidatus Thermoplasmatota archaeon]|nr:secondary thiamine-phosphate synthase enzyme YjbQ [Candidatus Thermoplasmatota archaeon]